MVRQLSEPMNREYGMYDKSASFIVYIGFNS